MTEIETVTYTADELLQRVTGVYDQHPYLKYTNLPRCMGCAESEVRKRYGHEAASAWAILDESLWLLGEDR